MIVIQMLLGTHVVEGATPNMEMPSSLRMSLSPSKWFSCVVTKSRECIAKILAEFVSTHPSF